mmetsp:Transcript_23887/g.43127  ORF Transcript_23887/g.43127 Transcript_23887/m.43127 type:complete len:260 (-) Transcript_23887:1215-1994(-)
MREKAATPGKPAAVPQHRAPCSYPDAGLTIDSASQHHPHRFRPEPRARQPKDHAPPRVQVPPRKPARPAAEGQQVHTRHPQRVPEEQAQDPQVGRSPAPHAGPRGVHPGGGGPAARGQLQVHNEPDCHALRAGRPPRGVRGGVRPSVVGDGDWGPADGAATKGEGTTALRGGDEGGGQAGSDPWQAGEAGWGTGHAQDPEAGEWAGWHRQPGGQHVANSLHAGSGTQSGIISSAHPPVCSLHPDLTMPSMTQVQISPKG